MKNDATLQAVVANLMDGLITINEHGNIESFNPAAENIFGHRAEDIIGHNIKLLMPSAIANAHDDFIKQYCETGAGKLVGMGPREVEALHKDGYTIPVELAISETTLDGRRVFIGVIHDISERKHVLETLKHNEERFDLAMRGSNDGLWDWNLITNEVYFSPRWKQMLGYTESELSNELESWSKNVHPDDLSHAMQYVENYLSGDATEYQAEFRMRHKNGVYVDILSRGTVVRNEDGTPIRFVGTHVDMTKLKRAEKKALDSEQKFRTIFDSSADAIMLLDDTGFFDCNQATLKIFGCADHNDFLSKHPADLSPATQADGKDSLVKANEMIAKAIEQGENFFEWTHRRTNGEDFPAEVSLTSMQLDGKTVLEAVVRDITERKQAELLLQNQYKELQQANQELKDAQDQLLQSEKMASIGQLAAGVAHEINNPVGYVSSNINALKGYINELLQLLEKYEQQESLLPDSDSKQALLEFKQKLDIGFLKEDLDDLIKESLEGVSRVKKIVQDLKDFSHVDEATWETADLHQGLDSTLNIVHNELKYKAEIIKEYGDIPRVNCLPSQLNQIFMNLLVNAGHAITDSGKIFIRSGCQNDDHVWIEIEDTGSGIDPEHLKKIFEPFFTTKEVGKGTGLGLSLTYGIIKKHHGDIQVRSEIGKGTCFRITLPVEQNDPPESE